MALLRATTPAGIAEAAAQLQRGGLLGLPTETVYGLAADVAQDEAVRRIFSAKGRPADHPLIAHIAPAEGGDWRQALSPFVRELPPWALQAMHALWPGPLTLVLPRRVGRCEVAAGGLPTLAVRCPSHPGAQAVLSAARDLGVPGVAAPSANRFGRVSPTTAQHVMDEFADHLSDEALLVLDGGACSVGIESPIVDASRGHPVLLRPGLLTPAQLAQAFGQSLHAIDAQAPKVSGSLASHYAPRARVVLIAAADWAARWAALSAEQRAQTATYAPPSLSSAGAAAHHTLPSSAAACAHDLFAVLRDLDQAQITEIWVAQPPQDAAWAGVNDRLARAAA